MISKIIILCLCLFCLWLIRLRFHDIRTFRKLSEDNKIIRDQYVKTYEQMSRQTVAFDEHMRSIIHLYGKISNDIQATHPELCELIKDARLVIQRYREVHFDDKVEKAIVFINKSDEIRRIGK